MNWKRSVCVILLTAIAGGVTAGIVRSAAAEVKAPQLPEETQSPRSPNISQTLAREKVDLLLVRMMIRAEELAPGSTIEIMTPNRSLVQTLTVNDQHEAVTNGLEPGQYLAQAEQIGSVLFSLHENASVAVIGGSGWSDGEIVYLSTQQTGTVRVSREYSAQAVAEGVYDTYSLLGQDYSADRIIHIDTPSGQTAQACSRSCTFAGLPSGTYTLWENGVQRQTVTVAAGEIVELKLD